MFFLLCVIYNISIYLNICLVFVWLGLVILDMKTYELFRYLRVSV